MCYQHTLNNIIFGQTLNLQNRTKHTFRDMSIFGEDVFQGLLVCVEAKSTNKKLSFVRHFEILLLEEEKKQLR